jgi:peptidyl-prolyl cis-trans isomerase SurA
MQLAKQLITAGLLIGCLAGGMTTASAKSLPQPNNTALQPLDGIVARVNSAIITQDDLNTAFHVAWQQQQAAQAHGMPAVSRAKVKKMVLENLIAQKIQLQMAKQQGVNISSQQLDQAIKNIAEEHHITTSQLYSKVESSGMSKKAYRQQIHDQITIMTLQRGIVGSQANVTTAEIKAYQQAHSAYVYRVGDILLPLSSDPSKSAMNKATAKATTIKQALNRGKKFEPVANQHAPNNNAILDWRPISDLPDVFANTIQHTAVNQAAGPVRAPNGLHVLFLLGKKKNLKALSKEQVRVILFQQKSEKIISPWLKKLRDTSDIKIMSNP